MIRAIDEYPLVDSPLSESLSPLSIGLLLSNNFRDLMPDGPGLESKKLLLSPRKDGAPGMLWSAGDGSLGRLAGGCVCRASSSSSSSGRCLTALVPNHLEKVEDTRDRTLVTNDCKTEDSGGEFGADLFLEARNARTLLPGYLFGLLLVVVGQGRVVAGAARAAVAGVLRHRFKRRREGAFYSSNWKFHLISLHADENMADFERLVLNISARKSLGLTHNKRHSCHRHVLVPVTFDCHCLGIK